MKSEPDTFGIDDLARSPGQAAGWDGVRSYQARNMLRDDFAVGDRAFFHHSSCDAPGIYGTMEVVRAGHPDPTAFDHTHRHYDADSNPSSPRWYQVEVRLLRKFAHPVTLEMLRKHAKGPLRNLIVLRRGNRLSVMPVTAEEWKFIHRLAKKNDPDD
ncbi:MAG TPA: EVE domain-containing protein [Steroidobacteraceae bacterium]